MGLNQIMYCGNLFDHLEMGLLCNTYTGNRIDQIHYLKEYAKVARSRKNYFSQAGVRSIIKRLITVDDQEFLKALEVFCKSAYNHYIMSWIHPVRTGAYRSGPVYVPDTDQSEANDQFDEDDDWLTENFRNDDPSDEDNFCDDLDDIEFPCVIEMEE